MYIYIYTHVGRIIAHIIFQCIYTCYIHGYFFVFIYIYMYVCVCGTPVCLYLGWTSVLFLDVNGNEHRDPVYVLASPSHVGAELDSCYNRYDTNNMGTYVIFCNIWLSCCCNMNMMMMMMMMISMQDFFPQTASTKYTLGSKGLHVL